MSFMLRGIVLGFSIAAPVGPIGVLCIRRTLANGRASGFVSGLGAATADAVYGGIAAFGLSFLSGFLIGQQKWLRLIGGLFLCYLGVKTFLTAPTESFAAAKKETLIADYASTLGLTLTNPMTIISFVAIFAGLGVASAARSYFSASALVLGVFIGSSAWWLILSGSVGMFRSRFNVQKLRWVNRLSGMIIAGFGLMALGGAR